MWRCRVAWAAVFLFSESGCALEEVRSKTVVGPEFRHSGDSNRNDERWTGQQGIEFRWKDGVTTGMTYRRRDINRGDGDNDNGLWFEFGIPVWRAPKKEDALAQRIEALEQRIAELERTAGRRQGS